MKNIPEYHTNTFWVLPFKNTTVIVSEHTAKQNVARLSIFSNTFLTVAKLITGLSIGSVSTISEEIH